MSNVRLAGIAKQFLQKEEEPAHMTGKRPWTKSDLIGKVKNETDLEKEIVSFISHVVFGDDNSFKFSRKPADGELERLDAIIAAIKGAADRAYESLGDSFNTKAGAAPDEW